MYAGRVLHQPHVFTQRTRTVLKLHHTAPVGAAGGAAHAMAASSSPADGPVGGAAHAMAASSSPADGPVSQQAVPIPARFTARENAGFLSGDVHSLSLLMERMGCPGFFSPGHTTSPQWRRAIFMDLPTEMGVRLLRAFEIYVRSTFAKLAYPGQDHGMAIKDIFSDFSETLRIMARVAWKTVIRRFLQEHTPIQIRGHQSFRHGGPHVP